MPKKAPRTQRVKDRLDSLFSGLEEAAVTTAPLPTSPEISPTSPPDLPEDEPLFDFLSESRANEEMHINSIITPPEPEGQAKSIRTPLVAPKANSAGLPALVVPVQVKDQPFGRLEVASREERDWSEDELRLVEQVAGQLSLALENAHLFQQTRSSLARTEALYNFGRSILASENLPALLHTAVDFIAKSLPADRVALILIDQDLQEVILSARSGRFSGKIDEVSYSEIWEGFSGWVLREKKPALSLHGSDDSLQGQTEDQRRSSANYSAMIVAPLHYGAKTFGTLTAINNLQTPIFNQQDMDLLAAMANQVAVAISNMSLLEESRQRASQLEIAAEIARETSSSLNLDALLQRTVQLICDRFGYYHASIFLLDETETFAVVRASTGVSGEKLKRQRHKLAIGSQSVIGHVANTGQPLLINDVNKDPIHQPNSLLPETRAELGIPLKIEGRVSGVLDVQSARINAFSADDTNVLQILADQIAVAVNNARLYGEQREAAERLRELDQLKSQFLANMSHELRTPLNSIIGFSRVILKGIDGPISELQEQDLTAIYSSGQHLLSMINDILDFSKIEAGKMEIAFEEINLEELVKSVLSTASGLLKDKPVELRQNIPPDLPLVHADPLKIRQVLINLLSNAAKFTDAGSISVEASFHPGLNAGAEIVVSVVDTGPGIAAEDQHKLFEAFSQVDASLTRKTGGSGLGLSICRALVEMHGGRIGLHSQVGRGSTFFFTLPTISQPEQDGSAAGPGSKAKIVLAIDDNPQVTQLYERYLKNHGIQLIALSDPAQALAIAGQLQPFAILLDLLLPGHDGWQILAELKDHPPTSHIPVILCTILEEEERGLNLGADGYLSKPILEEDLIKTLNRFLPSQQALPE